MLFERLIKKISEIIDKSKEINNDIENIIRKAMQNFLMIL